MIRHLYSCHYLSACIFVAPRHHLYSSLNNNICCPGFSLSFLHTSYLDKTGILSTTACTTGQKFQHMLLAIGALTNYLATPSWGLRRPNAQP